MWGMSPIDQLICRIQFRQASLRGLLHPADRRPALHPISRLQRRLGLGRHRRRSGARRDRRQLQRHAQLQPAGPARGSRPAGLGSARSAGAAMRRGGRRGRSAGRHALCDQRQRRLAVAAHRAAVQAAALWRHPRHRPAHRQDALGPPVRQARSNGPFGIPSTCRSTSARRTTAARWSRRAAWSSSPRRPTT